MSRTSSRRLFALAALLTGITASSGALAAPTPGETAFKQRCAVCHTIAPGATKMGPPLKGVVGRKAGTLAGYAYSPAMKASGLTWTAANLDKYLAKPAGVVPGTKMMIAVPDATQRAAIVTYLSTQAK
ncbi:MAG: cytochrome c class [Phenylobacterium sp.]|nr:cytochrome c class [Phenylobacterium sp.]HVK42868.1 c-type cytochrome [Phenylobacterium sp.]